MNLVKEYKGVKIFVSIQGEFYCDAISNSNDYKKKTFASAKLTSIEKAIDDFSGQDLDGNSYYEITTYNQKMSKIKIVKKVGDRLFFDDGTDTSNTSRRLLYHSKIEESPLFQEIKGIFNELAECQQEINKLYKHQTLLKAEAEKKLKNLSKVKVS